MRIIFNDEQHHVSRLQILAIIRDVLSRMLHDFHARQLEGRDCSCRPFQQVRRGPNIGLRQVQREGAALSGHAAQLNFATEQVREFAADCKTKTGAAVLAASAGICLLERLEDDALFVAGNSNAGICDFKGND